MEAQEFIDLLEAPEKAKEKGIDELKKLAQAHPYSQPLQLLYAIRLRKSSEHLFNQQLGKASILTNDRSVLFDLFEQEELDVLQQEQEERTTTISAKGMISDLTEEMLIQEGETERASLPGSEDDTALPEKEKEISKEPEEAQKLEPLKVLSAENSENSEEPEEPEVEEASDSSEEEENRPEEGEEKDTPAKKTERKEKNIASLPADERIKAILERNRKLREDFESKKRKGEAPLSDMDMRLKKIREKLEGLKRKPEESEQEIPEEEQRNSLPEPDEIPAPAVSEEDKQEQLATLEEEAEQETKDERQAEGTSVYTEAQADEEVEVQEEMSLAGEASSDEEKEGDTPHFTATDDEPEVDKTKEDFDFGPLITESIEEENVEEEALTESLAFEVEEEDEAQEEASPEKETTEAPTPVSGETEETLEQTTAETAADTDVEPEAQGDGDEKREAFVLESKEEAMPESHPVEPEKADAGETMSFADWVKRLNKTGGSSVERLEARVSPSVEPGNFDEKVQLLDSFVEKLPSLKKKVAPGPKSTPIEIGNLVNEGSDRLVTETLAKVYIEQKHYDKAMKAYQILKLKYPEKSAFFAAQILEIKKLKDNK